VLRQLRRDAWGCAIPVVVFTTSTEPADMRESYRRGANSFISKAGALGSSVPHTN